MRKTSGEVFVHLKKTDTEIAEIVVNALKLEYALSIKQTSFKKFCKNSASSKNNYLLKKRSFTK